MKSNFTQAIEQDILCLNLSINQTIHISGVYKNVEREREQSFIHSIGTIPVDK